jgi:hypothetical protein
MAMNADYLRGERIRLELSTEQLHVLIDALREAMWPLEEAMRERRQLLEHLRRCRSPEQIAEAFAEADFFAGSLEEVRQNLAADEKLAGERRIAQRSARRV